MIVAAMLGALCIAMVLLAVVSLWVVVSAAVVLASAVTLWRMLRMPDP
jgi:hypothetical protein